MLGVCFDGIDFENELTDIIKLFCTENEYELVHGSPSLEETGFLLCGRPEGGAQPSYVIGLMENGAESIYRISRPGMPEKGLTGGGCAALTSSELKDKRAFKREVRRGVYTLLSGHTGKRLPWGMLTGIRPAKIVHELMDEGLDRSRIESRLTGYFMVSPAKAGLLYRVAEAEREILSNTPAGTVSLYIGIPFCATRCLYCSFASNTASSVSGLLDTYIASLKKEIALTAGLLADRGLKLQNIYIGGGTPTVLDTQALKGLLDFVEKQFELAGVREYTLEAGRPDSLDGEKLLAIRESAVNRISINPQTMNDATLKLIGRNHTPDDVLRAFELAREAGFDNINMDVIMGLPGEDAGMFEHTLRQVRGLCPESLTVHALAVKRASGLAAGMGAFRRLPDAEADNMMDTAVKYAGEMGLHPYYLYRQKNIAGNLENTGFCKPGRESLYNVQIMEERQSIIAVGAGAVTKVVYPGENRIERAFNVKNPEEYIRRVDEMLERKKKLLAEV
jgi:coproporphyrinogen dehydrogenase HemZ